MASGVHDWGQGSLGDEPWPALESLARALHVKEARLQPTLDAIVSNAVESIELASYAGVTLLLGGVLTPQATLGEPPYVLDLLQQQLGDGPCVQAARTQRVVRIDTTGTDGRWPQFSRRAVELGVASMVCLPLQVEQHVLGALSLYSTDVGTFQDRHLSLVSLYATLAALALGDAHRTEHLHTALSNRDLIGQAKGILVERLRQTPDEAFRSLSQASQSSNRKLVVVAQHLVETGELLGPERAVG